MKVIRLPLWILLAAFVYATGCATKKPTPDPLAGWQFARQEPSLNIEIDYKDYIQNLSVNERNSRGPIFFFEDGTGQHAIKFETGQRGTSWSHVLIYDKDGKRIKVVKYVSGHYRS